MRGIDRLRCTVYGAHMVEVMRKRVIYMRDPEWEALREEAARRGTTISALIREIAADLSTGKETPRETT